MTRLLLATILLTFCAVLLIAGIRDRAEYEGPITYKELRGDE